ncbi:hypothetical protein V8C86DRAFT_2789385 [Haematococcus lacustris]
MGVQECVRNGSLMCTLLYPIYIMFTILFYCDDLFLPSFLSFMAWSLVAVLACSHQDNSHAAGKHVGASGAKLCQVLTMSSSLSKCCVEKGTDCLLRWWHDWLEQCLL